MRSTGEVMGQASDFGLAFAKAEMAAGTQLPLEGTAFLSVNDNDQPNLVPIAQALAEMGFRLLATTGTGKTLRANGIECERVYKVNEGRPNIVDLMKNGEIDLLVNTPLGRASHFDEKTMRQTSTLRGVPLVTTLSAAHDRAGDSRSTSRRL
jgi:carbamoyl-phosphate synthase large subunit